MQEPLSLEKALRFARHDFLNELQIILMNIDLGFTEDAKETILTATKKMQGYAALSFLQMPKTAVWLESFEWVYPAYTQSLTSDIHAPITTVTDEQLVEDLTKMIEYVNDHIQSTAAYQANFELVTAEHNWWVNVKIKGKLPNLREAKIGTTHCKIEAELEKDSWAFTLREK